MAYRKTVASLVAAGMTLPLWSESVKKFEKASFIVENGRQIPVWQAHFFLPIGFGLLACVLLYRVVILWTGARSSLGETPIDEDPQHGADPTQEGV